MGVSVLSPVTKGPCRQRWQELRRGIVAPVCGRNFEIPRSSPVARRGEEPLRGCPPPCWSNHAKLISGLGACRSSSRTTQYRTQKGQLQGATPGGEPKCALQRLSVRRSSPLLHGPVQK